MLYSTAIENTNNIFYCSVKTTYVAFLTLTLIITNYCSGTFLALHVVNTLFLLTVNRIYTTFSVSQLW